MKCEFCHTSGASNITNIELDIGFRIGDFARETMGLEKMATIKPVAISVSSIHTCYNCTSKLGKNLNRIRIQMSKQIMKELKESLNNTWLKQMILNALEK